jgi:hypothetical protein
MSTLRTLLLAIREGHDSTQTERFIVTRGGSLHLWGMYRQAMREMDGRVSSLVHLMRQIDERVCDFLPRISEYQDHVTLAKQRETLTHNVFRGTCDRIEFAQLARRCRDTLREFTQFFHMALGLHEHFHPNSEAMAEEARRQHELDFWAFRLRLVAVTDLRTTGTVQASLLELIPTLPQPTRSEFLAILRNPDTVLDWYEKLCEEGAPQVPAPSRRYTDAELATMIEECAAYVPATQPVGRITDSHLEGDASRHLLEDRADAVRVPDDLLDRSPTQHRAG